MTSAFTAMPMADSADGEALGCDLLSTLLEEAWGTGTQSGLGEHWLSPSGLRASLIQVDRVHGVSLFVTVGAPQE